MLAAQDARRVIPSLRGKGNIPVKCFFYISKIITKPLFNLILEKTLQVSHFKGKMHGIDEFQINEINVDLRTSGFDNEVLSVDACAV